MLDFLTKEQVAEILNGIIKIGVVSSVNYAKCTARVEFADDDETVSFDMQILQRNAFRNTDFAVPDVGEDVICIFLPSGKEEGFILGSVYAGTNTPPETAGNYRTVVFQDGTRIRYDRSKHELSAEITGGTSIFANSQDVIVTAANSVTITGTAAVTVNTKTANISTETALVNAKDACTVTAQGVTVTAPAIALNGEVAVTGNVTASGKVTASNIP